MWAVVGMAAGVYAAAELVWPQLNFGQPWLSFGRMRTVTPTTSVRIRGIGALIGTAYYSVQRTSHVRLLVPWLAWFVFYAWQLAVAPGAWSLLAGRNGGKEYAELEWPFDIAIAVRGSAYALVFFGTIARRTIRADLHIELVDGALIIVIAMLHIVNSLALPATLAQIVLALPRRAGRHRAMVVRAERRRLSADRRFLGMLYYFLPKQAEQPIWSYRLSIVALLGVRVQLHLGWTASPALHRDPGMGAVAGRGHERDTPRAVVGDDDQRRHDSEQRVAKLRTDPALKFIVLALAFYGSRRSKGR